MLDVATNRRPSMAGAYASCDDCDAAGVLLTRTRVAGEDEDRTRCQACLRAAEIDRRLRQHRLLDATLPK